MAGQYEDVCEEYDDIILLLKLTIYMLISFAQHFTTFSNELVFTSSRGVR